MGKARHLRERQRGLLVSLSVILCAGHNRREGAHSGGSKIRIETLRDRDGSFEPVLVPKHARRFTGFDDKVTALYARGA